MEFSLDQIDLGFAVSLATLRKVLGGLSINGRKWWVASDPNDALESRAVTIGHGDPGCRNRLNTLYFRFPVLNVDKPMAGTDRLTLLLDCSVVSAEQAGLYLKGGRVLKDLSADLDDFFDPIERALMAKLQRDHF